MSCHHVSRRLIHDTDKMWWQTVLEMSVLRQQVAAQPESPIDVSFVQAFANCRVFGCRMRLNIFCMWAGRDVGHILLILPALHTGHLMGHLILFTKKGKARTDAWNTWAHGNVTDALLPQSPNQEQGNPSNSTSGTDSCNIAHKLSTQVTLCFCSFSTQCSSRWRGFLASVRS